MTCHILSWCAMPNRLPDLLNLGNLGALLGALLAVAFAVGAGYSSLAAEDERLHKDLERVQAEQQRLSRTLTQIQTGVAVIRANHVHLRKAMDRIILVLERRGD
jgi:Tfp pilus assembly protein PilO